MGMGWGRYRSGHWDGKANEDRHRKILSKIHLSVHMASIWFFTLLTPSPNPPPILSESVHYALLGTQGTISKALTGVSHAVNTLACITS